MGKLLQSAVSSLNRNSNNIFVVLLPFLLLYGLLVFFGMKEGLRKDEWRYVYYANQLLQGKYSPDHTIFLWNGPGYPLFLAPFMALGLPLGLLKMLNAFFLYLSLVYFYKSLTVFFSRYFSLIITVALGAYWPAYEMLPYLMTEPFVIFLMTLLLWSTVKLYDQENTKKASIIMLAFLFSMIALTKVIFGYVLLVMMLITLVWYLVKKKPMIANAGKAIVLGLIFCLPYLIYTYTISGKLFYWGNAGGMQLYWMSTPYEGEFGDWINFTSPVSKDNEVNDIFKARHGKIINELFNYPNLFEKIDQEGLINRSNIYQDEGFKKYAFANIRAYPGKFLGNWAANISRMLFDFPYSYKAKKLRFLKHLIPNVFLLAILVFGLVKLVPERHKLPFPLVFLMVFVAIYLAGSSLLSAYPRQFYITAPILTFWVAFGIRPFTKTYKQ